MNTTVKASKRNIKASKGDQIIDLLGLLYDISDQYNTSHPVSGHWDTEANHEMLTIADSFNISPQSAKALMINELGFSNRDFERHNNQAGWVSASTDIDEDPDLEVKRLKMYGDYECSCGCGELLGRPNNGEDGKPVEISIGVGRVDDEEGFEWRMFTKGCWNKLKRRGFRLDEIYDRFPECYEV